MTRKQIFIDGKPVFYFKAETETDNYIRCKMWKTQTNEGLRYARYWGIEIIGTNAIVYANCPQLTREQMLKTILLYMERHEIA